jgi:beta-lactamase class A
MNRAITFKAPVVNATYLYPPTEELQKGARYSAAELLRRAISFSDNESAALLGNVIGFGKLTKVFNDFGIEEPEPGKDYQMRVRTYASFFRVLYNASYINREHSEQALKLLSENDFREGIVAGVPAEIVVAHKFGEREGTLESGNIQLHDCGIVYAPHKPYLLCVMAQGKTTGGILGLMRHISAKTYAAMLAN